MAALPAEVGGGLILPPAPARPPKPPLCLRTRCGLSCKPPIPRGRRDVPRLPRGQPLARLVSPRVPPPPPVAPLPHAPPRLPLFLGPLPRAPPFPRYHCHSDPTLPPPPPLPTLSHAVVVPWSGPSSIPPSETSPSANTELDTQEVRAMCNVEDERPVAGAGATDGKGQLFKEATGYWRPWPALWQQRWRISGRSPASTSRKDVEEWKGMLASGMESPTIARPNAAQYVHICGLLLKELLADWNSRIAVASSFAVLVGAKKMTVFGPTVLKESVNALQEDVRVNGFRASGACKVAVKHLALYSALRVAQGALLELRGSVFTGAGERARRNLMQKVFSHLHTLDYQFHATRSPGSLVCILERGDRAIELTTSAIVYQFLPTFLEMAMTTHTLANSLGPSISRAVTLTMLAYAGWTIPVTHWRSHFKEIMNRYSTIAASKVNDSLRNHELVKLCSGEAEEAAKFDSVQAAYGRASVNYRHSLALLHIGQKMILATGTSLLLKMGMDGVAKGTITLGDFVMLKAFVLQLQRPLELVGAMYTKTRQGLVDLSNMFFLLNHVKPSIVDPPGAPPLILSRGQIELQKVSFAYHEADTTRKVLKDVSLTIRPGETLGVVGPSGGGKTTLLRLLTRSVEPTSGRVLVDGQDISRVTQRSLRKHMSVVPQEPLLFQDTIAYNISYGRLTADRYEVEDAARKARLQEVIARRKEGYHTIIGVEGSLLSGGERQRLAIARALLRTPRIILYDEATSSLDASSEGDILRTIREHKGQATTVMVAHRLNTVKHADRIVV
eukprot:Sspe_Gene.68105::Locus_40179_Transcript_1_1_Confidence_1.000_Length_2430::g.68105::m.68105/K05663/ABC.ATM; mitochondrial ABC transporter ATM